MTQDHVSPVKEQAGAELNVQKFSLRLSESGAKEVT